MKNYLPNLKVLVATMISATVLTLVACDKKDQNNNSTPYPGYGTYGQGCVNCFANPVLAMGGMKSFTGNYSGTFTMDLLVSQSGYAMNWQDPLMLNYYSGPAALQGYLDITTPSMTFCGMPAGRYGITTTQAGMMYAKTLSGLILNMSGPGGVIQAQVTNAMLTNTLDATGPRMAMSLAISVNGYSCGTLVTSQF